MAEWERFATEDPYFYICTDEPAPRTEEGRRAFFARGAEAAEELLREVEADLPGWSSAIEIGCGVGRLLLPTARRFALVSGVDVAPSMLTALMANAGEQELANVRGFLPHETWDAPPASADYVFSFLVFQHIEDVAGIADYVRRTASVLRPGGIAHLQFDTRPASRSASLRKLMPDAFLPRTQRRGIRRVRRDPRSVRELIGSAGLEVVRERDPATVAHRFVARRPR